MRRRSFLAAAAGVLGACGYSLQGRGITTDPSVKTIGVPLFTDATGTLGLDTLVTAAVTEELLKRGRFTVVKDVTNVDAVVEGEILSYRAVPVNYAASESGATQASRYAISLVTKVVYRKVGESEPIWSDDHFSQRDEYDIAEDRELYLDREEQSRERLAQAFGRSLVAAMLEAF